MNTKEVVDKLYNGLTDNQQKFWDKYIKNSKNMTATCADMGISKLSGWQYKSNRIISLMIDVLESKIVETKEMPTLMWTLGEYVKMYESVVKRKAEAEDNGVVDILEEKQRGILKDIKDYQKAFGEAIDEDDLRVSQLSWAELVKYFNELKGDIELRLAEGSWHE